MASFVLSFFPLDVLDEIWDLIESVSDGFLTYVYFISLLSNFDKVFERLIFKHTCIYNRLRDNNILTVYQSGFTPGDTTINQLTYMYDTFCSALDSGKEVRVVFCDISKAFDRVWHKGLIRKLKAAGITGTLPKWFKSYLEGRKQRVVIPGT